MLLSWFLFFNSVEFILVYLIEGKLCCQGAYGFCWFTSFNYQEKPRVVIWWKVTQWAGTVNHTTRVETERLWAGRPRKKVLVLMLVIPTKVYPGGWMMELQNPKSGQRIKILHQSHNHPLYLITMSVNSSIINYKFKFILRAKFFPPYECLTNLSQHTPYLFALS